MKVILALLGGILLLTGCHSVGSNDTAPATAVFRGNTPGQISKVLDQTFIAHGYQTEHLGPYNFLFEKKDSLGSNILYGDWGETPLWIRVKAKILAVGEGAYRVNATAWRVRDRGDSLETETPLGDKSRKHLQEILDECTAHLRSSQ